MPLPPTQFTSRNGQRQFLVNDGIGRQHGRNPFWINNFSGSGECAVERNGAPN